MNVCKSIAENLKNVNKQCLRADQVGEQREKAFKSTLLEKGQLLEYFLAYVSES